MKPVWHVFPKRHEVRLVIGLLRRTAQRHDAVVVLIAGGAVRNSEKQIAVIALGRGSQARQISGVDAIQKSRYRSFRQHDKASGAAFGEGCIDLEDAGVALGTEFEVLLDVSLQQ